MFTLLNFTPTRLDAIRMKIIWSMLTVPVGTIGETVASLNIWIESDGNQIIPEYDAEIIWINTNWRHTVTLIVHLITWFTPVYYFDCLFVYRYTNRGSGGSGSRCSTRRSATHFRRCIHASVSRFEYKWGAVTYFYHCVTTPCCRYKMLSHHVKFCITSLSTEYVSVFL